MSKIIHMYYINKIKTAKLNIFEAEDDDYPNRKKVRANERAIEHYLDKAGIVDENLRKELLENIRWTNDNCKDALEKLGWEIRVGSVYDEHLKYNCNYSEFDFKLHNENYHYYCEVVIDETGKIHYAHPSHQEYLINKACKDLKITRQELYDKCPSMADWFEWLMELTNCVCVWYEFYKGKPNELQMKSLEKLQEYKCCDFENR